jgi:hypothetical protein
MPRVRVRFAAADLKFMIIIVRLLFIQLVLALSVLVPLHCVDFILPTDTVLELSQSIGEDQGSDSRADFDALLPSTYLPHSVSFSQIKNTPRTLVCAWQTFTVAHIRAPPLLALS